MWIHLKCLVIKYKDVKNLSKDESQSWKCQKCLTVSSSPKAFLEVSGDDSLSDQEFDSEIPRNLSLATEINSVILKEYDDLKQALHNSINNKTFHEIELDDKTIELQDEIQVLTKRHTDKENEGIAEINSLKKHLDLEKASKDQIIV